MPDLELHGFTEEEAVKLRREIFAAFPDRKELIINICGVEDPEDRDGKRQPFFRLFDDSWNEDLILGLRAFGDVEFIELRFYPKR